MMQEMRGTALNTINVLRISIMMGFPDKTPSLPNSMKYIDIHKQ